MSSGAGPGRASDFVGGAPGGQDRRRGKIGRTLRGGSPPTQAEERTKPVRITVDLDPERHRRLKLYALDASAKGAEVIRALLDELEADPSLSDRVKGRIAGR